MSLTRALRLGLLLLIPATTTDAKPAARSVVAFVVGIEAYDQTSLNQLRYVAENAAEVWKKLESVNPEFELARSRLYLADREPSGTVVADLPSHPSIRRRSRLTADDFRVALQEFLNQVPDGATAILYLGGHGDLKRDAAEYGVSYLPSNFVADGYINNVSMKSILDEIRMRLSRKSVDVVLLVNTCYAGALAAMAGPIDPDDLAAETRGYSLGGRKFAYIPAVDSAPEYEREELRGSAFAYWLIDGLGGNAADRDSAEITTRSLLDHLQDKITPRPLPPLAFAGDIRLGNNGDGEARQRQLVGLALGAAALESEHRLPLLELAARHFERSAAISSKYYGVSVLRQAQALLLAGGAANLGRARQLIEANHDDPGVKADPVLQKQMAALRSSSAEGGHGFHAVVISVRSPQRPAEMWADVLSGLPGRGVVRRIEVPLQLGDVPLVPSSAWRQVQTWVAEWRGQTPGNTLVLVYDGIAGARPGLEGGQAVLDQPAMDPFWATLREWSGPGVLVFDAPYGGLVERPPDLVDRVSMLRAARQPNGMTFSDDDRLVHAVADTLVDGELDSLAPRMPDPANADWVVGTPDWVGKKRPPFWVDTATFPALDWPWLGFRLEDPYDFRPEPSETQRLQIRQASERSSQGDLAGALEALAVAGDSLEPTLHRAVLQELTGATDVARAGYREVEQKLSSPALAGESREATRPLLSLVQRRLRALDQPPPAAHVVPVGIDQYDSPAIPDLGHAAEDVQLWLELLRARFPGERLKVHAPERPTAAAIRDSLKAALTAASDRDLVVLLFSGRGYTTDQGERLLVSADADRYLLDLEPAATIRLGEVARMAAGHALLAIIDAQFCKPGGTNPAYKQALPWQHHVEHADVARDHSDEGVRAYPSPPGTERQAFIWWEGQLEEGRSRRDRFVREPAAGTREASTLFSTALLAAAVDSKPLLTYRAWVQEAGRRLDHRRPGPAPPGVIACQGPLDQVAFSTYENADELMHLLQRDRRELRLRHALAGKEPSWASALDSVSRAALLVELGETLRFESARSEVRSGLDQAEDLLDRAKPKMAHGDPLYPELLYWYGQVGRLLGRPEKALDELLDSNTAALSHPALPALLVALTREAIASSATEKLERTSTRLSDVSKGSPDLDFAIQPLRKALDEEARAKGAPTADGYGPVLPAREPAPAEPAGDDPPPEEE